jgi:site-specific recombinase XerD
MIGDAPSMLRQLWSKTVNNQVDVLAAQQGTCLDPYFESFEARLRERNYKAGTIKIYRVLVRRLATIIEAQGLSPSCLSPERAAELVHGEERKASEPHKCANIARRFAEHLIDIGVAPSPPPTPRQIDRENLRRGYEDYHLRQRGLSERTAFHSWRFADRFLDYRFGDADMNLSAISGGDVIAFLQRLIPNKAPFRDKTPAPHLRNFFRYLFKCGLTSSNLALCVPSVAKRHDARLPRYLTPDQVEAVLAAVRADPQHGRRDYAMMLLLARLGLRAPEVVSIQLDDIDWRAGELLVRGKGQRHDRVPIPHDVGEALTAYIRLDRVSTSRSLFVSLHAPHGPFKDGGVLNNILKQAFATTGVTPPGRYIGTHVLRHSLATNMVRKGASLAEVSDMLRHRSRASTMIYAKLDIDGLRSIARPWPAAEVSNEAP